MAKIDPIRRAEIGREKRARTHAQLVVAANSLFARQAVESVTVDDVVKEAGVAKGTFYVHFQDLQALAVAVAQELVRSFDELLQPARLSISEPELRIALGCSRLLDKALDDQHWARVVARMATAAPNGLAAVRGHFLEDMRRFSRGLPQGGVSPEVSLEIVVGMMLQLLSAFGEGRLSRRHREDAIAAILRAIGLAAEQIKSVLARLPASKNGALALARAKTPRRRPLTGSAT
jgi:AcrR family transcriptional regulator